LLNDDDRRRQPQRSHDEKNQASYIFYKEKPCFSTPEPAARTESADEEEKDLINFSLIIV
jgi:hypothetical protein